MPESPLPPRITLDLWPHPLTAEGRETRPRSIGPGATLAGLVGAEWRGGSAPPLIAALDSRIIAPDEWAATPLRGGELVTLRAGLAGDSNPLSVLLSLAVGFVAPYLAPALGLSGFGAQLFTVGLKIAGGLIANALFPPRVPEPIGSPTRAEPAAPVYSTTTTTTSSSSSSSTLRGGANRAPVYEPLLLVLGEHRVFPDLAAAEYTEFQGDEQ